MLGPLKRLMATRGKGAAAEEIRPDDTRPAPVQSVPTVVPVGDVPALKSLVVPQGAYRSWQDDPAGLLTAATDFINLARTRGQYRRSELPLEALMAVQGQQYLECVRDHGHARFVRDSESTAAKDLLGLFRAMEARDYLAIARDMARWMLDKSDQRSNAAVLDSLDARFNRLNARRPLQDLLAEWVADLDILRIVPDIEIDRVHDDVCAANPLRSARQSQATIAQIEGLFSDRIRLAVSVAAGALPHPEPVAALEAVRVTANGGERGARVALRTVLGERLAMVDNTGATIHEIGDGLAGRLIGGVDSDRIARSAHVARKLSAAAAIDLLLSRLPHRPTVDFVTIHKAGRDNEGGLTMTATLILNHGNLALVAEISDLGATLLSDPDRRTLATASADEIGQHTQLRAA